MKCIKSLPVVATIFILGISLVACKKQSNESTAAQNGISSAVMESIGALGFSTTGVKQVKGGYVVEGDIFLSAAFLNAKHSPVTLNVAKEEQYRTTNLLTGLPRTITVSIENFPAVVYTQAADIAIAEYNALKLKITFQRVAANGNIRFVAADLSGYGTGTLGLSAGFPDANGALPNGVTELDPTAIGANPYINYVATIIAHEMGHDIGFRHTDYFNRHFSCPQSNPNSPQNNEGDAGVGAINIPGTPTTEDIGSWMLACIPPGGNRPFTQNDMIALNYLYGPSALLQRPNHIEFVIDNDSPFYCPDGNTIVNNTYYSFRAVDAAGNPVWPTSDITISCSAYVNGFTQTGYLFSIGSGVGSGSSQTFNSIANCNGPQDAIFGPFTASDSNGSIPVQ